MFYDATLRYRACEPVAPYCAQSPYVGGSTPTTEVFRGLDVAGAPAFANHIVCCNGHYWTLTWYSEATDTAYRLEFEGNVADRYGHGISPDNVAGARALTQVATNLVALR